MLTSCGSVAEIMPDIQEAWEEYLDARREYWLQASGKEPNSNMKLSPERRKAIGKAIRVVGLEAVKMSARGLFLSQFHRDNKFLAPEYAFRLTNIERFAQLVREVREEAEETNE